MSTIVLGPERAMMKHPEAQAGFLVKGSANIDAMLAKGWVILECDRNHLIREYRPEAFAGQKAIVVAAPFHGASATLGAPILKGTNELTDQPKRGPGRPKKVANNNK